MNVEIGTMAAQIPEKEDINEIFFAMGATKPIGWLASKQKQKRHLHVQIRVNRE
jgi:hypothetical protein